MDSISAGPEGSSTVQGTSSSWARRTGFKTNMLAAESGSTASDTEISNAEAIGDSGVNEVSEGPISLPKPPGHFNPHSHSQQHPQKEAHKSRGQKIHDYAAPSPPAPTAPPPRKKAPADGPDKGTATHSDGEIKSEPPKAYKKDDAIDIISQPQDADDLLFGKPSHMKYGIRETPDLFPFVLYGIQQYLSIIGSIILVPLIIVPAMGGDSKDVADVISTTFFVTGMATLLHCFLGTRLPLIQGASFVYLAPALAIINSSDFVGLTDDRFKHTIRELQGAIIISSGVQIILGYTGLLSFFLRLINPVVVAPTVAAIGLSFFSYGFPIVGMCVEIGLPQIFIVFFFALYLRKISISGHRVFQIFAVPLGLIIVWIYAFLLTSIGVYNFSECHQNLSPVSEACTRHERTMRHCRTDTSNALRTASWIRFPYPMQWGTPTFHLRTAIIMSVVSVIASVDSVGTYHAASMLVAARAPTPGIVSRGIGLEGITSALAGLWGTGSGATTFTENVHTIAVTKIGSRRSVEFGACFLIFLSIFGKVGAFIASIPQVIVAALLCVLAGMLAALGLSNLRYSETGSSRNVIIVGLSLFLSLSIPAYFQDYGVNADFIETIPTSLQPYVVSEHGPFRTEIEGLNFILNILLSLNMVIAFLVAFCLDIAVPGSQQERGIYMWSQAKNARDDPAAVKDYGLPFGLGRLFRWVKCVGL